jgi:hypothetical protein
LMRVMQGSAQQHRGYQTAWLPGHVGSAISLDCAFVFEIVTRIPSEASVSRRLSYCG